MRATLDHSRVGRATALGDGHTVLPCWCDGCRRYSNDARDRCGEMKRCPFQTIGLLVVSGMWSRYRKQTADNRDSASLGGVVPFPQPTPTRGAGRACGSTTSISALRYDCCWRTEWNRPTGFSCPAPLVMARSRSPRPGGGACVCRCRRDTAVKNRAHSATREICTIKPLDQTSSPRAVITFYEQPAVTGSIETCQVYSPLSRTAPSAGDRDN
jgi:hypothetical protein